MNPVLSLDRSARLRDCPQDATVCDSRREPGATEVTDLCARGDLNPKAEQTCTRQVFMGTIIPDYLRIWRSFSLLRYRGSARSMHERRLSLQGVPRPTCRGGVRVRRSW